MIVRRIKPQHRLKNIWALASKRMICEPDMLDDENGDNTNEAEFNREAGAPPGHGGCGHEQPVWRKEGLKLTAVIRPPPAEKGEVSRHLHYKSFMLIARKLESSRSDQSRLERSTMSSRRFPPPIFTSWVSTPNTHVQIG
jgi:hypothetical protein